jgi:hypothetical protein
MDAEYYYATARELAAGRGFTQPFVWNYLNDPVGAPQLSHLYWMPFTSMVAAGPMAVSKLDFRAAQIPFMLLTAGMPLLAAWFALRLKASPQQAWLAGWLAAFAGFYLPFMVTTDTFSPYALIGSVALLIMADASQRPGIWRWLAAGALVGLAHLTRADGVLLMVPGLLAVWWSGAKRARSMLLLGLGYLAVMAPWLTRNMVVAGSMMPRGTSRALWLLSYDELFSYPATMLTPARWWQAGLLTILRVRLEALLANLGSLLAVNGMIFLGPLMIVGAVRLRKQMVAKLGMIYLALLLLVMTVVFPHAGARGGFFHSSAALMPLLWALAAVGLERAVAWVGGRRDWPIHSALSFFRVGAILLAAGLTTGLFWSKVIGPDLDAPRWEASAAAYLDIGGKLAQLDPAAERVAVNNPPGLSLATGVHAFVIPNGGEAVLKQVVERYQVEWVVLEANHPEGLKALYGDPHSLPWLQLVESWADSEGKRTLFFKAITGELDG